MKNFLEFINNNPKMEKRIKKLDNMSFKTITKQIKKSINKIIITDFKIPIEQLRKHISNKIREYSNKLNHKEIQMLNFILTKQDYMGKQIRSEIIIPGIKSSDININTKSKNEVTLEDVFEILEF